LTRDDEDAADGIADKSDASRFRIIAPVTGTFQHTVEQA
jgi:hypothetical protein